MLFFFFQAEDGIRDKLVTGVQTCALPIYLFVIESTKTRPELRLRHRGDLVHHQAAGRPQAVPFVGLDGEAEQRSIGGVRCEGADRYGGGRVEPVILHDDDGAGLPRIVFPAGSSPDLAASHSETASIKS